jgi:hypothetical protein
MWALVAGLGEEVAEEADADG